VGLCPQFGSGLRGFGVRAGTAAGAATDAVTGASVVAGMSDGAFSDTGGVLSHGFTTQ
jgi:hypothetical protein